MNKLKIYTILALSVGVILTSCNKEPDAPPVNQLSENQIITIDSLRSWYNMEGAAFTISDSLSIYATVIMDEVEGNIYKNLYVNDGTASANMRLTTSSDYVVGDSLRISLLGVEISEYAGVFQINNVDTDKNIIKQASDKYVTPTPMTFEEITLEDEGKLIVINNIQFVNSQLGLTYADAINQASKNRYLEDCDGNSMFIRTSGFANFANKELPEGNGSMVCIISRFNDDIQLLVRSEKEVDMTGPRCPGQLLVKDFDDNSVTSGGWVVQQVIGTDTWVTGDIGGTSPYVKISNYSGGTNNACENWLISPALDLSNSTSASFTFLNTQKYSGPDLEVLVSTNYSGTGDPNGATWTALNPILDTDGGSWALISSGVVDLSAFLESNVRIAFKYTGTGSNGKTWELDDIIITG